VGAAQVPRFFFVQALERTTRTARYFTRIFAELYHPVAADTSRPNLDSVDTTRGQYLKDKWIEFEKVADYKTDEMERLQRMPIHNYYLHILALKRRADDIQTPETEDNF
jgi:hypothetical protein